MSIDRFRFVITGCSAGIGAGTASLASPKGMKVMISDMNDAPGEALAEEINVTGEPELCFFNGAIARIAGGSAAWRGTLSTLGMEAET
ncbi:MAG: SDR family NAD(P)-dependent oxidoreductase [Halioglobus sp.]